MIRMRRRTLLVLGRGEGKGWGGDVELGAGK
jgi:hypothetical protein